MQADVLAGPSPWLVERIGARIAGEIWTRVPEAFRTAVARAVGAQPHARTTVDRLLPNPRWQLPYEELVLGLGSLPGAEIVTSPRGAYTVVAIRGHVLLPWWYGPSGARSMRVVHPGPTLGRLARELLRRFGPPLTGPVLPLVRDEIDAREVAHICAELAALTARPTILIAGYAATADHGLLRACVGQVGGPTGWQHVDDLPLPAPVIPRRRQMRFPAPEVSSGTGPRR
jgi:hypothetical protein